MSLSLNFKTCRFSYWGGGHVAVGISLLYLCFYSLSLSQFQLIFVSFVAISAALCRCFKAMFCLSKFSPTGPKESGQNKCNQRRPTEGLSYTNCCMGLMGLKSENEKRECEKETIPLMFCMSLISLHCEKNYGLVWNVTHLQPLIRGGRISLPNSLHVRGWRRMTFQTTYGYLRSWSRD